jgi:large subunit ribosomal protein L18e
VNKTKATNPELLILTRFLRKQGKENKARIWQDIAERLTKPERKRTAVNLSRINRHTKKNETVAVPGKLLGSGGIDHPITVAAFAISEKAKEKIGAVNGKILSFHDLIKKNPKGSNIKIIG